MRNLSTVVMAAALSACAGPTRTATALPLPRERAAECVANCDTLGMALAAIVIIRSSAGCVCAPKSSTASAAVTSGAAAAAGGAAIAADVDAATQRQERQIATVPTADRR